MDASRKTVRYTDRHKGRGREYHDTFSPEVNPYRAMVWRLEQQALAKILGQYLKSRPIAQLDFACGTGRILEYCSPRVSSITGVDVSDSMLEVARKMVPEAEIIEADLTENDVLGQRSFDLITAFRFFPNAETELRRAVFSVLARHLAPRGVLVFNNHKNRHSVRSRVARLRGRGSVTGTMTDEEVKSLLAATGLRVVERVPVASLPLSDKHVWLPLGLVEPAERWLSGWPGLSGLAQNIIYVCTAAGVDQAQSYSSPSH